MARHKLEQITFLILVLLLFVWAAWDSLSFPSKAQTYPLTVALAAIVITLAELLSYAWGLRSQKSDGATATTTLGSQFVKILPYLLWLAIFYVAIYLIGMVIASSLFVFLFLLREGKMRWYYALLSGLLIIVFLLTMEDVMSLKWPRSLIDPLELLGF